MKMGGRSRQAGNPVDDIDGQVEAVDLVSHGQFKRGVDVAVLLVAPHVEVPVVRAPVGEPVDQPGIAVEIEDYRLVRREEAVEVQVGEAVLVLGAAAPA